MSNIKIWAHRGASAYAPENTLEAFDKAVHMKADGVELDVQMTKDGHLVVTHDETIQRVSDGSGYVKDYTLQELKRFRFNKTHPSYQLATIPTLEEVYDLLYDTGLTVNVELKTGVVLYEGIEERVLELAGKMGMEKRVLYSSFNHYSIVTLRRLNPQAKTGILYSEGFVEVPEYGERLGVTALHPGQHILQIPGYIEDCRRHGKKVHVWTVNDEAMMKRCYQLGVDAVITNYPDVAIDILKTFNGENK